MFFNQSQFVGAPKVSPTAKVIFVADLFCEDYVGGAELTSQALIDSAPFEVCKLHSKDVTMQLLAQHRDKYWIFGNFAALNGNLIPSIIANLRYSILEYDYKYCAHRSADKHLVVTGKQCDCHNQLNGKLVSAFYYAAKSLWWMSERQMMHYLERFPFLGEKDNVVLGSVFSDETLGLLRSLTLTQNNRKRENWVVLGSDSWIKSRANAEARCVERGWKYEVISNAPYREVLEKLSHAEGFVYLPAGGDTCPRMVIEAKILGCKLELNDNVQHKDEEWFATDDVDSIIDHLYTSKTIFWNGIKHAMEYSPKISGYVTTYNCVSQGYPLVQCVESMRSFCSEICIVDGGSTDDTLERLTMLAYPGIELKDNTDHAVLCRMCSSTTHYEFPDEFRSVKRDPAVRVKIVPRNWTHPRHALYDGEQKALARMMCTGDFCWQMDCDEIVHEDDAQKIKDLCSKIPNGVDIVSLPVIEYWGSSDRVRIDVPPWKWRLSKNKSNITHGVPAHLMASDELGAYALPGTDGCDMIDAKSRQPLPHVTFVNEQTERVRIACLNNVSGALPEYERWFNMIVEQLPVVFHYSWHDIARKIRLYKSYWTEHWNSLNGKQYVDDAESNMFFDLPWSEVTDQMIDERAKELAEKTGGHVWHSKWNGCCVPHITCKRSEPSSMKKK